MDLLATEVKFYWCFVSTTASWEGRPMGHCLMRIWWHEGHFFLMKNSIIVIRRLFDFTGSAWHKGSQVNGPILFTYRGMSSLCWSWSQLISTFGRGAIWNPLFRGGLCGLIWSYHDSRAKDLLRLWQAILDVSFHWSSLGEVGRGSQHVNTSITLYTLLHALFVGKRQHLKKHYLDMRIWLSVLFPHSFASGVCYTFQMRAPALDVRTVCFLLMV